MLSQNSQINWHGHRGCRGLMPENTVPAFLKAIELGAHTLEMDIVVSKDKKIILSHEPWMSHIICSHPDGTPVKESEAVLLNLYAMTLDEIQQFDCGLRPHPRFPDQKKMRVCKPSLEQVVSAVNEYCKENGITLPSYNIEMKSHPDGYSLMVPRPNDFVQLVLQEIRQLKIEERTILQSFDKNILEELNNVADRNFEISYLVQNSKNLQKNLDALTFRPDIYSPHFRMIKKREVKAAQEMGIKVVPWTVNAFKKMTTLKRYGVDGIITDYPDLISEVK